jgi:hypothetical protein
MCNQWAEKSSSAKISLIDIKLKDGEYFRSLVLFKTSKLNFIYATMLIIVPPSMRISPPWQCWANLELAWWATLCWLLVFLSKVF